MNADAQSGEHDGKLSESVPKPMSKWAGKTSGLCTDEMDGILIRTQNLYSQK